MSTKKATTRNAKKAPASNKPKAKEKKQRLTDKQRLFVAYYLASLNGTEAAIQAYDTEDRIVAANIASENLRKPYIRAAIDEELQQRTMTANEVLARLTEHALGSASDFVDVTEKSARLNLVKARDRNKLHLIKEITEERREIRPDEDGDPLVTEVKLTIKLYDAQAALRDLGRYHKLFVDRTEVTGKDGDPIPIEDARDALARRIADRIKRSGSSSSNPEPQPAGS